MKFILNLWPPSQHVFEEITTELAVNFKLLDVSDYEFSNKDNFEHLVREIYKIDGAKEEGVNIKVDRFTNLHHKKVARFKNFNKDTYTLRCIQFDIPNPKFRPRGSDGKPISTETEAIKKHYRHKYKGRIPNYIWDIIIHIGDNEVQTEKLMKLFGEHKNFKLNRNNLDMNFFLSTANNYKYFISKIDTPYVPQEFPNKYAIGKDLDIIVSKEHFEEFKKFCNLYSKTYPYFEIVWENETNGFGIRFEKNNQLHFKLDVRHSIEHISDEHINNSLNNRVLHNGYYITENRFEKVFREVAYNYSKRPKPWHKEWLNNNG